MLTKIEKIDEAMKLLKNDSHYYVQSKENMKELVEEVKQLDEYVGILKTFTNMMLRHIFENKQPN